MAWRDRQPTPTRPVMTPERVVELAKIKGEFTVSWRYRDERLARMCFRLVDAGKLKKLRRGPGHYVFAPVPADSQKGGE